MNAAAAILLLAVSGCSVMLMDKPPPELGEAYPQCSESAAAPLADVALTIIGVSIVVDERHELTDDDGLSDDDGRAVAVTAGLTLAAALSAAAGFYWQTDCQSKRAAWERRNVRFARPSAPYPTTAPVGPPRPPPRGGEGEPCYPNGTCDDGFTCEPRRSVCQAPAVP
ncbi:MAG TPA: hypothetical protein VMZ28_31405 [Kofleriaceae bacterium]|nr:hypothetical protein [Kofleriaceae bacterium]